MKHNKIASYDDLILWHLQKSRNILSSINPNKQAIYWSNEDTFGYRYKDNDIIEYWGKEQGIKQLAGLYPKNYIIFSPGDYYYLDCGFGNKYGSNAWCDPFKTWSRIYSFDPADQPVN